MTPQQIIPLLSEPSFGDNETAYFKHQLQEHVKELLAGQMSIGDLREACRLKYRQLEAKALLLDIDAGSQIARDRALERAVTILLKEAFYL